MSAPARVQSPGLRRMLLVSGALVFLAGVQLFVFPERTEQYFAWTIAPPLTASFLGAGYFAAVAMEWLAARHTVWVAARLVAVTILVFASLTLLATVLHLDRFHFGASQPGTVAVTWVWLLIYAFVPPLMLLLVFHQRRMPGQDPARRARIEYWFKAVFGAHALIMVVVGIPLFIAPASTATAIWPWDLTPLTGRTVAAWLVGMGFAGIFGMWENDWARLRPMAVSFVLLTVLQSLTVLRHRDTFDWAEPRAWLYLWYLADMLALALVALVKTGRVPRFAAGGSRFDPRPSTATAPPRRSEPHP